MNIGVIALVVGVVAVTYVVVQWRREKVEKSYEKGKKYRELGTMTAAVIIAWLFIRSGDPLRVAAAIGLFVVATIYVVIEQPQKEIV